MKTAMTFSKVATGVAAALCLAAAANGDDCAAIVDNTLGLPGMNGIISAFVEYDGDLIAGGPWFLMQVPINCIGRWDREASAWHILGEAFSGSVQALTVFEGELIAGGGFSQVGDVTVNRIARWDAASESWQAIGGGFNEQVLALAVYEGELIAGGLFTQADGKPAARVARWDGVLWQPVGTGMNLAVRALHVFQGDLIAGGDFGSAGGAPASRIARWDGVQWQPLANGMNAPVRALSMYKGDLIAGGDFSSAGGAPASRIARWDGEAWFTMGLGTNGQVWALVEHGDHVVAGGTFSTAGNQVVNRIARWNGNAWQPLDSGMNHTVNAVTTYGGEIIAGGRFTLAGGEPVRYVASWDGASWGRMGTAINSGIYAVLPLGDAVIIGGAFTTAGGQVVNRIARRDAASEGWQPLGTGFNGPVYVLAEYNGQIIAGGAFTLAGDRAIDRIARWDEASAQWLPMGGGVSGCYDPGGSYCPSAVLALLVRDGDLIVGGTFEQAGTLPVNNIARWDGEQWHDFGGFTVHWCESGSGHCRAEVRSLIVYDGAIVAGGTFQRADGVWVGHIARRDDASGTWKPLAGGGLWWCGYCEPAVRGLAVYQGDLIAVGSFYIAGGQPARRAARWDGERWYPLGAVGPSEDETYAAIPVHAVAVFGDTLYIGGRFTEADGKPMAYAARWNDDIGESGGWEPLDRQPNYTVLTLDVHDGGLFVSGDFFRLGPLAANRIVQLRHPPTADLNGDGAVDVLDLLILLDAWGACPKPGSADCPADLNGDGAVDVLDLLILLANWG